jgi:hypothetical protein
VGVLFLIVVAESAPAPMQKAAQMAAAVWKPVANWAVSRYAASVMPAAAGRTATAMRAAPRATSLLTADATPACRAGTAARTVAVSGATVTARPSPSTVTAGSTSVM